MTRPDTDGSHNGHDYGQWTGKEMWRRRLSFSSAVAQSCPTLYDPMDCSTPGLPVHRRLPEVGHTRVIGSVMPSNLLVLCCPLLLLPSILPSIGVFFGAGMQFNHSAVQGAGTPTKEPLRVRVPQTRICGCLGLCFFFKKFF